MRVECSEIFSEYHFDNRNYLVPWFWEYTELHGNAKCICAKPLYPIGPDQSPEYALGRKKRLSLLQLSLYHTTQALEKHSSFAAAPTYFYPIFKYFY